jgi:hypothetical protein
MNRQDWSTIKGKKYDNQLPKINLDKIDLNIHLIISKYLNEHYHYKKNNKKD